MDIQGHAVISLFEYPVCGISPGSGVCTGYKVQGAIEPLIRYEHVGNWMRVSLSISSRDREI